MKLKRNYTIGLFFFLAFAISMLLINLFEAKFDETTWKTKPDFRYEMVDDIIEKGIFIGKKQKEIISLLGKPNKIKQTESDYFIYSIGKPTSFFNDKAEFLQITFKNKEVIKVSLAQ